MNKISKTLLPDFFMFGGKDLKSPWQKNGRKFEIPNPSVENFDMNTLNPSVLKCALLISNP